MAPCLQWLSERWRIPLPVILTNWRTTMNHRHTLAAILTAVSLLTVSGCAVTRGQESVGAYVDDTAITTAVKARFVDNKLVDAASISVETLNGTVMLAGFAKNSTERGTAETLTWKVGGVKAVRNEIAVRP
jgi:hyperosmotically inducible protein